MKRRGFTLIEMVIVLTILSFLTINVAIAIRNGFNARQKIQEQVQDMSQVRDSLKVIERDINVAFHYRDLEEEFRKELKKAQGSTGVAGAVPGPGFAPAVDASGNPISPVDPKEEERKRNRRDPVTHFVGSTNEVWFATLSSSRMSADLKQADFIKVGYSLKPCRNPATDESTQCLVRSEDPLVEGETSTNYTDVVLLRDVSEFKLRYFGKGKQDWNNDWNSISGDGITKNAFPNAVEISLTIERGPRDKKKKISMQTVAGIRFPNNEEKKGGPQGSAGMPGGGGP